MDNVGVAGVCGVSPLGRLGADTAAPTPARV